MANARKIKSNLLDTHLNEVKHVGMKMERKSLNDPRG